MLICGLKNLCGCLWERGCLARGNHVAAEESSKFPELTPRILENHPKFKKYLLNFKSILTISGLLMAYVSSMMIHIISKSVKRIYRWVGFTLQRKSIWNKGCYVNIGFTLQRKTIHRMECMMYSLLTSSLRHPKRLNSQIEETLRCLCIIQAIIIKKLKKYNSLS